MRSDSSSSQGSSVHTLGRKSAVPTSPPNAWQQQRSSNSRTDIIASSSSSQSPMLQGRSRSGSEGAFIGMDKSPVRQEAQLLPSPSPRSLASFKRSMSRRSISSVPNDGTAGTGDVLDPRGQLVPHQYRSDLSLESNNGKEKRKLFGRREERSSTTTNSTSKGMVRKVSSRSFFGVNRDKNQDANASSDTLASVNTTSTARMELAKKAGDALSKTTTAWSRRHRKSVALKDEEVIGAENAAGKNEEVQRDNVTSTAEEEFSDLTPRGEGSQTSTNLFSGYQGTATNGADLQDRGEGLPKRLSGWLSGMLTTSTSNLDEQRNGQLSASDSHATVRRKTSSLSLSKNDSSDRLSSTLVLPPNSASSNGSQASTSRLRNTGLLSTLTSSGRARVEAASSPNGVGARSGLDRALRYFMDSGDQQQSQEEGMWLLGVWHGPAQSTKEVKSESERQPVIAITNPSPNVRDSRSSTLEGDYSSPSRQDSDAGHDDASIGNSSRRTRETSPSVASTSTGGSLSRANNVHTPEEDVVIARNPPTPQSSKTTTKSAASLGPTSNALQATRQQERSSGSNSSNASYVASFQTDFSSRIWCTYRSQFAPISRDGTISNQAEMAARELAAAQSSSQAGGTYETTILGRGQQSKMQEPSGVAVNQFGQAVSSPSPSQGTLGSALGMHSSNNGTLTTSLSDKMGIPNLWSRATAAAQSYGLGGRAGLTTDAGWGCMLRTGQSVLANALLNVHLGRDWRRDSVKTVGEDDTSKNEEKRNRDYVKYVELLSWFMDEPSLACPFGVHRMAREGKRLGKEVGEWFGPSTAAGAIKKLVDDFPEAGLGVTLASDGVIYLDQVRAQAQLPSSSRHRSGSNNSSSSWTRPVLVLIGVRLGLEGVHPMYHDSIKATFSFPHSVGIAGGRPSSSYYFMGYQGNSLFYLDPHHVRPSIPFRHPPPNLSDEISWWLQAYSEAELSTFHNDRPRRMPMKSLDPSMLLGFLISDEGSLIDFVTRVKALPRPIFSVLDSMPKWMMEGEEATLHDEEKALESFSESSLDDGLGRDGELGGVETLQGHESDEDHAEDFKQRKKVDRSEMSSNTMTPRTESTIEFIDRQAPAPLPRPMLRKDSDAGSAWEEVGTENGQHRELSSPVEAFFPQSSP
jgi:hypothetical protein